jgi:hypothetical protein
MEATDGRTIDTGDESGYGDPTLIPLWQQQAMLLLRAEWLLGAVEQALAAGDQTTALRHLAFARVAAREARELEERARNQ